MATKSSHSQSYLPFKRVIAVQETTTSSSEGTGSSAHTIGSEVGGDSDSLTTTGTDEEESSISEERCGTHSEKESECLSVCCKDNSRPCQPGNKIIISSLSNNGRNCIERWYQQFPWLTLCTIGKCSVFIVEKLRVVD